MPIRVLIVEDEIFAALDLEDALIGAGYEVAGIASDRREALALADQADVALVDLNLRDGPTGVTISRDLFKHFAMPVLFLTANAGMITTGVASAVGCLEKPCSMAVVCAAIEYATGASESGRAPRSLRLFQ